MNSTPALTTSKPEEKQKKLRTLRKLLAFLILAFIVAVGVVYYLRHQGEFSVITTVSMSLVALLLGVKVTLMLLYSWQLKVLGDHYGLKLGLAECFGITRISAFANLFLPLGAGGPIKAVYLKRVHHLRYSSFLAAFGVANLIKLMVFSAAAVMLPIAFQWSWNLVLLGLGSFLLLTTLLFFTLAHRLEFRLLTKIKYVRMVVDEWRKLRGNPLAIRRLFLISALIYVLASCVIYLSFRSFSIDVAPMTCGIIAAFTSIVALVQLVPANLGVAEAVIISVSALHGVGVNESLHAAALSRAVGTLVVLALGPLFAHRLMKRG